MRISAMLCYVVEEMDSKGEWFVAIAGALSRLYREFEFRD